jgi:hypothetical protein
MQVTRPSWDGDHKHDPGNAGANEDQPERPTRAQRAGGEHDLVLPEPRDQWLRQSRANEAADAG